MTPEEINKLSRKIARHNEPNPVFDGQTDWWMYKWAMDGTLKDRRPRRITEPEVSMRLLEKLGDVQIYVFDKLSAAHVKQGHTHKVSGVFGVSGRGSSLEIAIALAYAKMEGL